MISLISEFWSDIVKSLIASLVASIGFTALLGQLNWVTATTPNNVNTQISVICAIGVIWYILSLIVGIIFIGSAIAAVVMMIMKRNQTPKEIWKDASIQTSATIVIATLIGAVTIGCMTFSASLELAQLLFYAEYNITLLLPWDAAARIPLISLGWVALWLVPFGFFILTKSKKAS